MKVLVIDETTEGQARYAEKLRSLDPKEIETLDLSIRLASKNDYKELLIDSDIILIGSGLKNSAEQITTEAKTQAPWVRIILCLDAETYAKGAFRSALSVGVHKVLSDSAPLVDLLQELYVIHTEFCREGRTREGQIIVITSAKGGVGSTSIIAGLGELCNERGRKTLLWDLGVETRDLSRALSVSNRRNNEISKWIREGKQIDRASLNAAVESIGENADLLCPPAEMPECLDLLCHTDGIEIVQRILHIARIMYDAVIIDIGGMVGPAVGALLREADKVLVVVGGSALSISAVDEFLNYTSRVLEPIQKLGFICNNSEMNASEIRNAFSKGGSHTTDSAAWNYPEITFDKAFEDWAGRGKTPYSLGNENTQAAFFEIARKTDLVTHFTEDKKLEGKSSRRDDYPFGVNLIANFWRYITKRPTTLFEEKLAETSSAEEESTLSEDKNKVTRKNIILFPESTEEKEADKVKKKASSK